MDVFEFAKRMELSAKKFYQIQLEKTDNPNIREVLNTIIEQEQSHHDLFLYLQSEDPEILLIDEAIDESKNLFQIAIDNLDSMPHDELGFFEKALEFEQKSVDFYQNLAQRKGNHVIVRQLEVIANQERSHVLFIQSVIDKLL